MLVMYGTFFYYSITKEHASRWHFNHNELKEIEIAKKIEVSLMKARKENEALRKRLEELRN